MPDDERRISALEARMAVLERRADDQDKGLTSVNSKLWTGVWVVLAFVANQILGLLPWGPK